MAQNQPLVSVVVAAYQQPAYLNEALQSVIAQTYRPIEIIIVDDASGKEFTDQYILPPEARLIVHETRRATAAITRNTGIRAADGEYLAFLDQDDIWLPEKLQSQVDQLRVNPDASMIFCHFRWVDKSLNDLSEQIAPPVLQSDVVRQMITRNFIECPSQVLMRRAVLDKIGPFDENIRGTAAWELYIRAAGAGPILSDPRVMTLYRQHDQQWSQDSLMMRKGSARTMEKTASWLLKSRPDLWLLLHKRWARWLREIARAQFRSKQERPLALKTLSQALRVWPLDMQSYAVLVKGLLAKPDAA